MNIDRREFFMQFGSMATAFAALPLISWTNDKAIRNKGSDELIKKLTRLNDKNVESVLKKQIDKPGDRWHGGVPNKYGIPTSQRTNGLIITLGRSYASEFSKYYKSSRLEKPLERAAQCLLNVQYEDGTIDLHTTNFHSTPDTAFLVNSLAPIYVCLARMNRPGLDGCVKMLEKFLRNTGKCFQKGGVHTPNHRWVVSSALARVHSLFPSQKYVDRIDQWLSEGIGVDPDGQYSEQSNGSYSPITDNMLVTIGRLLNRPKYLDIVRKNLDMTLYYIQPDGEVVTDNSRRWDKDRIRYVENYYYAYRYLAIKDKNPQYAAVCRLIEKEMPEKIVNVLPEMLAYPFLRNEPVSPGKIPQNYFKRFEHSGTFRIRRGNTDITIIENNPAFLTFRKGNAVMQAMKLGAAFFGKGQFISHDCKYYGGKIVLKRYITQGYYQPYPISKRSGDVDWNELDKEKREITESQTLKMFVTIQESEGRISVEAELVGTPHVPVAWEMNFRKGGEFSGVVKDQHVEDVYFLKNGKGEYKNGENVITFGEGKAEHEWTQMRGILPKHEGYSVYLTGYTPFRHKVVIS